MYPGTRRCDADKIVTVFAQCYLLVTKPLVMAMEESSFT